MGRRAMMLAILLICWLAGFALLWKVPTCNIATVSKRNERLSSRPDEALRAPAKPGAAIEASLSLIIPARNEAGSLPRLLNSIAEQDFKPIEIIVVDDDSTDATAAIATAAGALVINAGPLPQGWRGKTWACQQGAAAAKEEHLLFLDADTWFEPGGLGRIMRAYAGQPAVLSVVPFHIVPSAVEQLSAFFNVMMVAGVGGFGLFGNQPDGLFGQMMLIDRRTYMSVDGHSRVRGQVLENLHLARELQSTGVVLRCFSGRGSLSMRMYPGGFRDLMQGWTKGFRSGAGATPGYIMGLTCLWVTGAMIAVVLLIATRSIGAIALYGLFAGQIFFMLRRVGRFWILTAALYPITLLFFSAIFAGFLIRSNRPVVWKGRTIHAD